MTFEAGVTEFTAMLREAHGFGAGHAATRDALRAATVVGIENGIRLRHALRAVYCATPDEAARFDDAFDAFFFGPRGGEQPALARGVDARSAAAQARAPRAAGATRRAPSSGDTPAKPVHVVRPRYTAASGRSAPPAIPTEHLDVMLDAAERLIARVRVAPSRRRAPHRRGDRVDVRRTLRASVATAGEPIDVRRTRRAPRAARFVVLIDGSRSNAADAVPMLQFAFALAQRARSTRVFTFSTALRDVSDTLRDRRQAGRALDGLEDAWGGGTRIGDSVLAFVHGHAARALSPSTVVLLFSDGLDVGGLDRLDRALRLVRARSSAIVWLHPSAGVPGFTPSAGGLRVARPYLRALLPAGTLEDFQRLAARI